MKSIRQVISVWMVIALVGLGLTTQAQRRTYRLNDRQVSQLIRNVETRADTFSRTLDAALDRSRLNGTSAEDEINAYVRDFENATDTLRSRFSARASVANDVESVLRQASNIDAFLMRNRLNVRVQNDWSLLKSDLNALASAYNVNWNWNTQTYPPVGTTTGGYPSGDRQNEQLIRRLENDADRFRASFDAALDRSRIDGTRREDRINDFIREFETATDTLRANFNNRTAAGADVQRVLEQGARINNFLSRNPLTPRVQNDWATVRTDLDALANSYNVAWNWQNNNRNFPPLGGGVGVGGGTTYGTDARLTGTFRIDSTRSDNARTVAQTATRNLPYNERQRVYDALVARLESPEMLAIERRGMNVTIASSRAPQTTFEADGRERTETLPNGIVARVAATLTGDSLTVSSQGYRENDFSVTFDPLNDGRGLRVTRRIYSERLTQPVVVQNTYDRIADVAQWNNVYGGAQGYPTTTTAGGDFIIRDGEMLAATLDNNLTTRDTKEGDRFTMTVRSPAQFEGATIEGTVRDIQRGGRVSGRSGMNFDFNTIRLRNGQSYRFAGFVDNIRTSNGETVRVDNEGSVQDSDSRTQTTVQRAAIGTAVGAVIGAIAGGGKGAAIGAILGGGAGAGSVYVQGRDELELLSGTEVTVRASSPNTNR